MLYFLANDPKVPPAVRHEFGRYGLCADEFVEFETFVELDFFT